MKLDEIQNKVTAYEVVQAILGKDNVTTDGENAAPGQYVVSRSWRHDGKPMFSNMDMKPGEGGAIGLETPLNATDAYAIASAAHEAFHAMLHQRGEDYNDEKKINQLTVDWIKQYFEPSFVDQMMIHIENSNRSYGHG